MTRIPRGKSSTKVVPATRVAARSTPSPPKVAVLAVLGSLEASYSVAGVVAAQLRLLVRKGHQPVLLTTDDFNDHDSLPAGVEVRTYPRFLAPLDVERETPEFATYVSLASKLIRDALSDCPVCITHDVIFLHDFLAVNWAMRRAAEHLPHVRWLHWMHSGPSPRPRDVKYPLIGCYSPMRNSNVVYVNRTDVPKVAAMFNMPEAFVRVVHNWVDPVTLFDFHPLSAEILEHSNVLSADVVCIYPSRLTPAKQPERIVKLLSYVKASGASPCLVICNSYSNADQEKEYAKSLHDMARAGGLTEREFIVTSTFTSAWAKHQNYNIELGVPRRVVLDLMRVSDLFILPSISEACSIIMLEAAMNKNLMVLNDDLVSLHEFGGQKMDQHGSDRAIYYSFGSISRPLVQYHPSEDQWLREHARLLVEYADRERTLEFFKYVRQRHTPDFVYDNQLGPLLY